MQLLMRGFVFMLMMLLSAPGWIPLRAWADTAVDSSSAGPAPLPSAVNEDFARGLAAYYEKNYAAAADSFELAVRAVPQSAEAQFYLGYALYELKRFAEAQQAFAKAYELQPDYKPPIPEK